MLRSRGRHVARMGGSFNALWAGQSISLLGDFIAYYTVPRYVLELTDQAMGFTTIFAVENLPTLLFGFFGGVLVDRWNRRTVAIVSDLWRAGAFALLAYLAHQGTLEIPTLVVVSFLIGTMAASFNAALLSYVPAIVPSHRLSLANSKLAMSQQLAFVAGPLIGVALVAWTGSFALTFIINGLTFVVSAISLVIARPAIRQQRSRATSFRDEVMQGLRFLWHDPVLRYTAIGASSANLAVGFVEPTLVLLGRQHLGLESDAELGLVFLAFSIGGVIGAVTASWVIRRLQLGRTFVAGLALFSVGLAGLASATDQSVVLLSLAVGFIGLPWLNVALVTIRQLRSPEEMLGRITAASRAVAWGSLPVGAVVGGYLADRVLDLDTVLFFTPILLAATGVWLRFTPVWKARQEKPARAVSTPS